MNTTLYKTLLSRLSNKHIKLSARLCKSLKEGGFQKQGYRQRKASIERLKSLEKRINGLCSDSGISQKLNYKHWAVALSLGAIVATTNPVKAQELVFSPPTILGAASPNQVITADLDNDGDEDMLYISCLLYTSDAADD